jgi:hypothetical protein
MAHQTLTKGHSDPIDRSSVQTNRRSQGQLTKIGSREVDRTDVCIESLRHQIGNVGKRLLEAVGTRNDLGDIRQK